MDFMDGIFAILSTSALRSLTKTSDAVNEAVGYIPGKSVIRQDVRDNLAAMGGGVLELYTLRVEAYSVLDELGKLAKGLAERCPGASSGAPRVKNIAKCFEVAFWEYNVRIRMLHSYWRKLYEYSKSTQAVRMN